LEYGTFAILLKEKVHPKRPVQMGRGVDMLL
jgi:hypothetical protein